MRFIGRKSELSKLDAEYNRDSSFVVIYGRRRVGKTTLIKEFLKEKTAFYFLATEELESQSMKRLAGVVARTTKNTLLQKAVFTDWVDLFQVIADYKPEECSVLGRSFGGARGGAGARGTIAVYGYICCSEDAF